MKTTFKKVSTLQNSISYKDSSTRFNGTIQKVSKNGVEIEGRLDGTLELACNRCGKNFSVTICQDLKLKLCDIAQSTQDLDTIECLDGVIDSQKLIESEKQIIQMGYNYCDSCDNEEDFEIEL